MALGLLGVILIFLVQLVLGQNHTNITSDPFLLYQPHFARSLPVQLLITGIVLTLTTTLLIHLCFTWQYHWPLARINWILQFTGACTLLFNVAAYLYVVLAALSNKSKEWPYMFEYVAIDVPRLSSWSIPEIAAWYAMEAATEALVAITHIQFLTFLYPSRLEARLVFLLLGPLAIVSSIMTLLPITTYSLVDDDASLTNVTTGGFASQNINMTVSQNTAQMYNSNQQLYDLFDALRNICNLTLSFLFTLSLLIWGLFVHRESAWRTDGGTAAFGAGALLLAIVSTALNFLKVSIRSPLEWLSPLLCAVILWQSFLGWWWWVGSASGIASRELDNEKRSRKERKRARWKKRETAASSQEDDIVSSRLDRWRSSIGVAISRRKPTVTTGQPDARFRRNSPTESIELRTASSLRDDDGSSSFHAPTSKSFFSSIQRSWRALRHAHTKAARVQAIEQRQIQLQMQRENGHGLGRFPGGPGGDYDVHALRSIAVDSVSDGERSVSETGQEGIEQHGKGKRVETRGGWLGEAVQKWRLRDSTTY